LKESLRPVRSGARFGTLGLIVLITLVLLGLVFSAWRTIRPGYVGIVFDKSAHTVITEALDPGWTIINPFTQAIQEYPVTIQTYSLVQNETEGSTAGDDSIKVQSKEGQQLKLDMVIQYQVIKDEAGQLYQDWGGADMNTIQDRVVRQYTRSQVPVVAATYGWEEIVSSKREAINSQLSRILADEFGRRHLRLISCALREVHLPTPLQQALDAKIAAQQGAERQAFALSQAQIEAEQEVAEATGHANALKAQAEGEAQATLVRARAQAEANRALAQSLSPDLIEYQQVQRWDGKLPIYTGAKSPPQLTQTRPISATAGR